VAALATVVIAGIGVGVRREQAASRKHHERKEKEKDDACFSMTRPDTVIHVSPCLGNDIFPAHRSPPFNEIALIFPRGNRTSEKGPWTESHRLPGHRISFL
jgi:hypothetical protein